MKSHRQYVKEQIKQDPKLAKELNTVSIEVRLAVMIGMLREKRGLTQRDLAKLTGIKQPQIARIEKGGQLPTLETLWRLADALDAKVVIGPQRRVEFRAA
jgi:DNA-binding XRE family transcriptional regulator